jgi:hypothetical protein
MYGLLTTTELNVLQSMLFEGSEDTYLVASLEETESGWIERYRPVHLELSRLFIEVATALMQRLDPLRQVA